MKNLKHLGKVLNRAERKSISGGNWPFDTCVALTLTECRNSCAHGECWPCGSNLGVTQYVCGPGNSEL